MAGNNKIQFCRGTSTKRAVNASTLNIGQPFYETDTHTLYIGGTDTALSEATPVNANPLPHEHSELSESIESLATELSGKVTFGTEDIGEGAELATGCLYVVYEE